MNDDITERARRLLDGYPEDVFPPVTDTVDHVVYRDASKGTVDRVSAHAIRVVALPVIADLVAEVEQLRRWKAEAIEVLAGWDSVYSALDPADAPLGVQRSAVALREVIRLQRIDRERHAEVEQLRTQLAERTDPELRHCGFCCEDYDPQDADQALHHECGYCDDGGTDG